MRIAVMKETVSGENRVPVVPADIAKLGRLGAEVLVETGTGLACRFADQDYVDNGAQVLASKEELLGQADIVLRLRKPPLNDIAMMRPGTVHISYLDPFNETELVEAMLRHSISAVSLEMIPRTTLAQKMDVLSSQANLAGYVSVLIGASHLDRILPMMTTPAGTIKPAKVFVIGVGVAGLQAIATARRLGARVEAFDTRPVVEEQVKSLGAKFVQVDLGETGQTKDGYAKELSPQQLEMQKQGMIKACNQADIVITTAQLFGRPAPRIIDRSIIAQMRPGSVIVDMAVESGGNVEGSELDKIVEVEEVIIVGFGNLPGKVALTASQMYSANLISFVTHFWHKEQKKFSIDLEDDILQAALVTHNGTLYSQTYKTTMNK